MMKNLIKDSELIAYIEDKMTPEEERSLITRLKENGELDILYHLKEAWYESMSDFADEWLGKDNDMQSNTSPILMAAKRKLI